VFNHLFLSSLRNGLFEEFSSHLICIDSCIIELNQLSQTKLAIKVNLFLNDFNDLLSNSLSRPLRSFFLPLFAFDCFLTKNKFSIQLKEGSQDIFLLLDEQV